LQLTPDNTSLLKRKNKIKFETFDMSQHENIENKVTQGVMTSHLNSNVTASQVESNINTRSSAPDARLQQTVSYGVNARPGSEQPPFNFHSFSDFRRGQYPGEPRVGTYFPGNGSSGLARGYGYTYPGAYPHAADHPNNYQANSGGFQSRDGFHNASGQNQSAMSYPTYPASFAQQHTIVGIHQYTHDELSDGFDQSYNHSLSTSLQGATPTQSVVGASGAPVPLRFARRAEAKAHQMNRKLTWRSPSSDVDRTVPQDDAQRSPYVHRLRTAMIEIDKTGPKLWKDKMAQGDLSEIGDIESVCWDLIHLAGQLHKDGPQNLPIFSLRTLQDAALSKNFTFAERIDAMIGLVLTSKTWVDSLMKGEKHATFVASNTASRIRTRKRSWRWAMRS
jgi:hypothetical protein